MFTLLYPVNWKCVQLFLQKAKQSNTNKRAEGEVLSKVDGAVPQNNNFSLLYQRMSKFKYIQINWFEIFIKSWHTFHTQNIPLHRCFPFYKRIYGQLLTSNRNQGWSRFGLDSRPSIFYSASLRLAFFENLFLDSIIIPASAVLQFYNSGRSILATPFPFQLENCSEASAFLAKWSSEETLTVKDVNWKGF